MSIEIRYFSNSGRTKTIADTFAEAIGIEAFDITHEEPRNLDVDILFIGGAPHANIMAPELRAYVERLKKENVKLAIFIYYLKLVA